jgi:CIC family chloride channel protein
MKSKFIPGQDDQMLNSIDITKIVDHQFVTLKKDQPVTELYKLLGETNINVFAVLGTDQQLQGVLWLDEMRKVLYDPSLPSDATIADVMVIPPAIIDYRQSAQEVMHLFDTIDAWRLPVVRDNRFVGFISKSAMLSQYRDAMVSQHKQSDLFNQSLRH